MWTIRGPAVFLDEQRKMVATPFLNKMVGMGSYLILLECPIVPKDLVAVPYSHHKQFFKGIDHDSVYLPRKPRSMLIPFASTHPATP